MPRETLTPAVRTHTSPQRVVVVGGGFAGVCTTTDRSKMLGRPTDVHVELRSEENSFVFQPLLPEVAADGVSPMHVVNPIREMVPRAQFRWSNTVGVDLKDRCVYALQGEGKEFVKLAGPDARLSSMVAQTTTHRGAVTGAGPVGRMRGHERWA